MRPLNLIPEALLIVRMRRRLIHRWSALAVAAIGIVGLAIGADWARMAKADQLRNENERLELEVSAVRSELAEVDARAEETLLHIQRATALRSKRAWSAMLSLIGSVLPPDCWLNSIATDPSAPTGGSTQTMEQRLKVKKGQQPRAIRIDAPRKLRLVGYAADAAQPHLLVARLKETGVFTAVSLDSSRLDSSIGESYFRFEMVCEW